jgi:phage host-nuclease inhibitor protein Gam
MKKMQENRSNEIFAMKREFNKMMDATVQDYEQRIATYQRDNEYLKMSMNQKVANIIDQTDKKLESQRTLFEDRRSSDVKSQQIMMDQRETQLKKNFSEMNITYQKKIDKMQLESDTKLKLITNDYESKLKELKALTSKELAEKDSTQQVELERLKQAYEAEKTRVVNAYESQIENLKQGHKDQMSQMNDYKRLS